MEDVEEALWTLKFDVVRSIRYHDYRRRAFDLFNKISNVITLLCSSAALFALWSPEAQKDVAIFASAIAAVFGVLVVVTNAAEKTAFYGGLKSKHASLLARIENATDGAALAVLRNEYRIIESDEPPISESLNKIAYNKAIDALGIDKSKKLPVSKWDYLLALI